MNENSAVRLFNPLVLLRWGLLVLIVVLAVLVTLLLVSAFASRTMKDLEIWHTLPPEPEFVAGMLTPEFDLAQYLDLEARLFDGLGIYMLEKSRLQGRSQYLRFVSGGSQDPAAQPVNWNRSVELRPLGKVRGGILLVHGLSDSPYSLRSQAEFFHQQGFHVLVLRMPGHGTVPAALLEARWQDWAAAVQVGVRHVRDTIGPSLPFFMGGYSNGGALCVYHTLAAVLADNPLPDQLILFSPAIGITPFARAARWDELYGFIPYFEKSRWVDIELEYDPYKYNSFAKNAGTQSWRLSQAIQTALDQLQQRGGLERMPPILAFQSIVDSTVETSVLISGLFERLPALGSEVVFFDVNRSDQIAGLVEMNFARRLDRLMQDRNLTYTLTKLTNRDSSTSLIAAHTREPGGAAMIETPLDLAWPAGVFSLGHVAVPFPVDDPLYGASPSVPPAFGLHIGSLHPVGEKRVLKIPPAQLIRIRHNPFHSYMEDRMRRLIDTEPGD